MSSSFQRLLGIFTTDLDASCAFALRDMGLSRMYVVYDFQGISKPTSVVLLQFGHAGRGSVVSCVKWYFNVFQAAY